MKIQKKNLNGEVVFQYDGEVVERQDNAIVLEAFFGREDMAFMNVTLKRGDRFVETFYTDRWYNIFEIFDRDDEKFKGWYCNIGKPAVIEGDTVSYIDLALDLWVEPGGTQTVLDEDELMELGLDQELLQKAYLGMHELQELLKTKNPPS
jgi:protein associated with RNAse G/E